MGKRRRRLKPGGPRRQYTSTAQVKMLNLNRKDVFKYHLTEILEDSAMKEEQRQTFKANVLSKASQVSINSAKDYIDSVVAEELLEEDTAKRIFRLLDDFAMRR
jgi:hypothetical protein